MTLADLLQESKAGYALAIFGQDEIDAIQTALIDKNGKPYIKCFIRQKEMQAKPEELIRQLWLHGLFFHCKLHARS
jgi:type I restriction enzyme M protein